MSKLTITIDATTRKLLSIESGDFRVRLNGLNNADYKRVLAPFGIHLEFQTEKPSELSSEGAGNPILSEDGNNQP